MSSLRQLAKDEFTEAKEDYYKAKIKMLECEIIHVKREMTALLSETVLSTRKKE